MSELPQVTVITAVFNGEKYLEETLSTVADQDYRLIEHIVVDDGSTDGSRAIVERSSSARLICMDSNGGQSAAINRGLAEARGTFIAFIDADDLWPTDRITRQVEFHLANPQYLFSYGMERFFNDRDSAVPEWSRKAVFQDDHIAFCLGGKMAHRRAFDEIGMLDEDFGNSASTAWFTLATDKGYRYGEIPDLVLHRRVHEENLSSDIETQKKLLFRALSSSIRRKQG